MKTVKSLERVFMQAYVRTRDKVGPLQESVGSIQPQWSVMAEDLNGHISSVFIREEISSLPVQYVIHSGG